MKIAICEDYPPDSELLAGFLSKYRSEQSLDFSICTYEDGDSMVEAAASDHSICIIFMDICMSPTSGMDAVRAIRDAGNTCSVVFTTSSADYYAESYEVRAEHYLVKPLTYERVSTALDRCRHSLIDASRCVEFTYNRVHFQMRVDDIRYIEVLKNTCYVHADRDYPVVASLDCLLSKFDDNRFFRCHKSFAVNLSRVRNYENRQLLLDDNSIIPISRSNVGPFKEAYGRYLTTQIMRGEIS